MRYRQTDPVHKPHPPRSGSRSNERQKMSYDVTSYVSNQRPLHFLSQSFENKKISSQEKLVLKPPSKQGSQIFLNSHRPRFFKQAQKEESRLSSDVVNLGYGKL